MFEDLIGRDGPFEVGLAAVGDTAPDAAKQLVWSDNPRIVAGCVRTEAAWGSVLTEIARAAALMAVAGNWCGRQDIEGTGVVFEGHARAAVAEDAQLPDAEFDKVLAMVRNHKREVALFVLCTKINYWQINHHTGQGGAQSYVRKVVATLESGILAGAGADVITRVMHMAGHWCGSRAVLAGWGIAGILPRNYVPVPRVPMLASDALLRLRGAPSGTSRLFFVANAFKAFAYSPYASAIPGHLLAGPIAAAVAEVKAMPVVYHPGAQFLTGKPMVPIGIQLDEYIAVASAFVHAALPGSTLSRAAVARKKDEVKADPVYLQVHGLAAAVADSKPNAEVILEAIKAETAPEHVKVAWRTVIN